MSIDQQVAAQMKTAMRERDKPRLTALRGIRAAFIAERKQDGSEELADARALQVLSRLAKQRRESIEAYRAGGREELAEAEAAELEVIEAFLPALADEATTRTWVEEAIAQTGATSKSDMGKVMGALMRAHKSEIDGKLANQLVNRLLS